MHDVVGHSLAVILAQAESAQYLQDDDTRDPEADDGEHRDLGPHLAPGRAPGARPRPAAAPRRRPHRRPRQLVDGVRASGHEVVATEVGTPQPLPPELEVVAYRVLQEMLTNAIKHGQRDRPVLVERHWEGDLRIEVRNVIDASAAETQPLRAMAEPVPEPPARGSTGCGAGSSRSAGGSTYAVATRPAARPSPRRRGCR